MVICCLGKESLVYLITVNFCFTRVQLVNVDLMVDVNEESIFTVKRKNFWTRFCEHIMVTPFKCVWWMNAKIAAEPMLTSKPHNIWVPSCFSSSWYSCWSCYSCFSSSTLVYLRLQSNSTELAFCCLNSQFYIDIRRQGSMKVSNIWP